jgi:ComF family protein
MDWIAIRSRQFLDAFFPQLCARCKLPSGRRVPLCLACSAEMPENINACRGCGLPLQGASTTCGICQNRPRRFDECIAPQLYTGPVAEYIQRLKYSGDMTLLSLLAELMCHGVAKQLENNRAPDKLVPMPLHWTRLWQRGFNQSELLALALARHSKLKHHQLRVDRSLCRRTRATASQSGLDYRTRSSNMRSAFSSSPAVTGLHLAIIDDVLTTGASAEALAECLKAAGAARVDLWCIARTEAPR